MGHTYGNLLCHVVFGTKERRPTIHETFRGRLHEYLGGVACQEFGPALAIGGTADHVHGLILMRTDVAVADAMRKWKSLSSGWVHKTFPAEQDFACQNGYAAFIVSQSNADQVKRYIANQKSHHKKQTFEEEFLALLDRHGIEYDPRLVWD
jgi:REP element-mobilizing transposase RayT